jgi:recombination protein RecR
MEGFPSSLERVIDAFSRFPGIGKKTAQRLGLHVLKSDVNSIADFANALVEVKEKISFCVECNNFAEAEKCEICENIKRNREVICVVEESSDIFLFENTGFRGVYQVLGGVLSPLDGIGPDELNLKSLMGRLQGVKEIIVATNTSVEGDATALYLAKLIKPLDIKVTRLARGIPVGGHLEYVDEATLAKSMNERVVIT